MERKLLLERVRQRVVSKFLIHRYFTFQDFKIQKNYYYDLRH